MLVMSMSGASDTHSHGISLGLCTTVVGGELQGRLAPGVAEVEAWLVLGGDLRVRLASGVAELVGSFFFGQGLLPRCPLLRVFLLIFLVFGIDC